jgi:hypothetical protein
MGSTVSHTNNVSMTSDACEVIKFATKPESDPDIGNAKVDMYADAVGMDYRNREAMKVLVNEGKEAFFKQIFKGDNGEQLDYAEMRSRYG